MDRYGIGTSGASWFMAVNLAGMLLVLPVLSILRRSLSPAVLLASAAAVNGLLYSLMSLPLGYTWVLVLRGLEGGPDLVSLAVVLSVMGRSSGAGSRGLGFGIAGTVMIGSLVIGLIIGGILADRSPVSIFLLGGAIAFVLAAFATCFRNSLPGPGLGTTDAAVDTQVRRYPIWPVTLMSFTDRGLAGGLTVAGTLWMTVGLELPAKLAAGLLAMVLLLMALLNAPMGHIADQYGLLRIRVLSAGLYGLCFMAIALSGYFPMGYLVIVLCFLGVAGAGLMPTSYALAARCGRGASDMGLVQGAGQLGFFAAIVGCALVFDVTEDQSNGSPVPVFLAYGAIYLVLNAVSILGVAWRKLNT